MFPIPKKEEYITQFGRVKDYTVDAPSAYEFRGNDIDKLINPPLCVKDNYHWMRDNERTNQEVLDHINNENTFTETIMKDHEQLKKNLYEEVKSYIKETYDTFPRSKKYNSKYKYFRRMIEGLSYEKHYRIDTEKNTEELLLDVNELSKDKNQCDIKRFKVSLDEKYYSYCEDYEGDEKYNLVVIDFNTRNKLEIKFPKLLYADYLWTNNNNIYYSQGDDKNRMCEVWLYEMDKNQHTKIYYETNGEYNTSINASTDDKYLFIKSGTYESNQTSYIDIHNDNKKMILIEPLKSEHKYDVDHHNGYFYVQTNINKCTNWKIMKVQIGEDVSYSHWQEFIPYNKDICINNFTTLEKYFIFSITINGSNYVNILDYNTNQIRMIDHLSNLVNFKLETYIEMNFSKFKNNNVSNLEIISCMYESNDIIISFETMNVPFSLYEYNLDTFTNLKVYTKEVPNYNEEEYECKRLYVPIKSSNKWVLGIPISLIYKKELFKQDGSMPLFLYGYGSYGITVDPTFDYEVLPLLNRGWIYAIAHVRGGSFLGTEWYEDGKMKTKMNTFNDFISCAEYLVENKYCDKNNITIEGRSAGGLLVGASMVLKPELFKNVVAGVPFVDVLNTMCDSTIPLTVEEWTQWGNPNIKEDYDYISQYCPYYNIKNTNYPNMYITAGLHDPRVQYWEPLKLLAKIREYKTDNNTQIIKVETTQGHFGGSSRYKHIEELAHKYAFLLTR